MDSGFITKAVLATTMRLDAFLYAMFNYYDAICSTQSLICSHYISTTIAPPLLP